MPMVIIEGSYRVIGSKPDGDTICFQPKDPDCWRKVPGRNNVKQEEAGYALVRLEGIDAPETHYCHDELPPIHQPFRFAREAAMELLAWLGFTDVMRGWDEVVQAAAPETVPGFIITRCADEYGRCIAFAFRGPMPDKPQAPTTGMDAPRQGKYQSGDLIDVGVDRLRQSANHHLLALGLAYPTFYTGLPEDLRNEMATAAREAAANGRGLWPADTTTTGVKVVGLDLLTEHAMILPKLFRRLSDYIRIMETSSLIQFPAFLAGRGEEYIVPSVRPDRVRGLHRLFEVVNGQTVRMIHAVEDVVFVENHAQRRRNEGFAAPESMEFHGALALPGVRSGHSIGLKLLSKAHLPSSPDMDVIASAVTASAEILAREYGVEPDRVPEKAIELFIANIVVASGARFVFDGDRLSKADIGDAFDFFHRIFNSLWHF